MDYHEKSLKFYKEGTKLLQKAQEAFRKSDEYRQKQYKETKQEK